MQERFLKLTNTAYKILEFLPEADPLKNKLKEKALSIFEVLPIVLETDGWASLNKDKVATQLLNDIDVFLGYLDVAKNQRWLDNINYLILKKEYEEIKKEIPVNKFSEKLKFLDNSQKDIKIPIFPENRKEYGKQQIVKKEGDKNEHNITERQKKILEILNEKEQAQVSDIIKILPDITKRTIRRDLEGLLEAGKIVRVGEWNKIFYKAFNQQKITPHPMIKGENLVRTINLS